jgi:RNA polymerase sigma-70 factor (ECF subfamily)
MLLPIAPLPVIIVQMQSREDIAAWVEAHTAYLWQQAQRLVHNAQLADELVQDTFVAALEARYEGRSSVRTWLVAILRHKAMDHFRRVCAQQLDTASFFGESGHWTAETVPHEWADDAADTQEALQQYLEACVQRLPAKLRLLMGLRYFEAKKGTQVCKELQITATNYWQQMHRARLQLRACIEHHLTKA